MNSDFKDLLSLFDRYNVPYLVIGGYAVMFYSEPRYTKDLDVIVSSDPQNQDNFRQALAEFGFPLSDANAQAFAQPNSMIALGRAPSRIDILNEITGVDFASAWSRRTQADLQGQPISFISLEDLIASKRAAGRPQDLLDLARLEDVLRKRKGPPTPDSQP